jgi:hypothetical protein
MTGPITPIRRDPFARHTTVRRTIHTERTCAWCGQNPYGRLFVYGVELDGISRPIFWDNQEFCTKSCIDAYYR